MQFINPLSGDGGTLQLMQDLGEAGRHGAASNLQMLGGGNPAAIPAMQNIFRGEMQSLLNDAARFDRMLGNYDAPQGNHAFREALAELLRARFGWHLTAANIALTNGSQAGFSVLFNLFAGRAKRDSAAAARKKILLPMTPEYIGYAGLGLDGDDALYGAPIFTGRRALIEKRAGMEFKYRVDFDNLVLDESVGAVCISRPTNPSGNVITDSEVERLRDLTRAAGVPLIIDGAYGLPFPGIVFTRARPIWDENIILCLSLSKLGMPGARCGIIIAHADVAAQVARANAIFTLSPGGFGAALAHRLLVSGELLRLSSEIIAPYYRARSGEALELVRRLMGDLPVCAHASEGAFFLWLWFPGMAIGSEELYQRLKRRGVLVIAGRHFFAGLNEDWRHRDECIRVSFAADEGQVARGMEAIAEEVRKGYAGG